jgi:hypothetical protein
LSTYDGGLPEGQAGAGSGQSVGGGLVDLSGWDLRDLRDLRDADSESCLARALSRLLTASEVEGHHGFQSKI